MRNYNILTVDSGSLDFQLTERLWVGQTLYELYKGVFMSWEWRQPLFDYAKKSRYYNIQFSI